MDKGIRILANANIDYLNDILLDKHHQYKSCPAHVLKGISIDHLHLWAHFNGVYQFVTDEMIEWLKLEIGSNKAIEIGAGCGVISRSLGITGTDSYVQAENKQLQEYYALFKAAITMPPKEILKYEALEAVRAFTPHTVIGAFISQYGTEEESLQGIHCSPYGVKEIIMLPNIKKYILFGNKYTHKGKHIFNLPHRELSYDWLITRSTDQSLNRVWVWEMS